MNSPTGVPTLTAPNKTFTAPSPARRPSNYSPQTNNTANSSPLPRSPSLELSDSFSVLSTTNTLVSSPIKQQPPQHILKPIAEPHSLFFSTQQLASIKPFCSQLEMDDWAFLETEKLPASHNP
jgi:hypothetical protein